MDKEALADFYNNPGKFSSKKEQGGEKDKVEEGKRRQEEESKKKEEPLKDKENGLPNQGKEDQDQDEPEEQEQDQEQDEPEEQEQEQELLFTPGEEVNEDIEEEEAQKEKLKNASHKALSYETLGYNDEESFKKDFDAFKSFKDKEAKAAKNPFVTALYELAAKEDNPESAKNFLKKLVGPGLSDEEVLEKAISDELQIQKTDENGELTQEYQEALEDFERTPWPQKKAFMAEWKRKYADAESGGFEEFLNHQKQLQQKQIELQNQNLRTAQEELQNLFQKAEKSGYLGYKLDNKKSAKLKRYMSKMPVIVKQDGSYDMQRQFKLAFLELYYKDMQDAIAQRSESKGRRREFETYRNADPNPYHRNQGGGRKSPLTDEEYAANVYKVKNEIAQKK